LSFPTRSSSCRTTQSTPAGSYSSEPVLDATAREGHCNDGSMNQAVSPLRCQPFRYLIVGEALSSFGNSIGPVALAFGVLDFSGSVTTLGLILAARAVANLIALPIAGVVADRVNRKLILLASMAANGCSQLATYFLLSRGANSVPLIALCAVASGTAAAFTAPCWTAVLASTLPPDQLRRGNALGRLITNTAAGVGLSVAGLLTVSIGSANSILVDSITFFIADVCFARLPGRVGDRGAARRGICRELASGWRTFRTTTWLWSTVMVFAAANLVYYGGLTVLGPAIADDTFGRARWGLVLGSQTLGYIIGGFVALRLRPKRMLFWGLTLSGLLAAPLITLGVGAPILVIIGASVMAGIGVEQLGVAWQTSIQQWVPDQMLARISSYDYLGSYAALPLGQAFAGPVSSRLGPGNTLIASSLLLVVTVLLAISRRDVRQLSVRQA